MKVADFGLCRHMDEEGRPPDPGGDHDGDPGLHEPRAGPGPSAGSPQRPLLAGGHLLFHAGGDAALPRRFSASRWRLKQVARDPQQPAGPPPGPAGGDRPAGHEADGQEPGRSVSIGRGDARPTWRRSARRSSSPQARGGATDALDGPYARSRGGRRLGPARRRAGLPARASRRPPSRPRPVAAGEPPRRPVKARVVAAAEPIDRPAPCSPYSAG